MPSGRHWRLLFVAAGLATAVALFAGAAHGGASGSVRQTTRDHVRTTLDGHTILPFRIRWIARPTHPGNVSRVDFLVDGKLIWTEHGAPYVFGGDEGGAHMGFLFTSWLSPGRHGFTARATYSSGNHASDKVVARVKSSPSPPSALAGSWTRKVTQDDLKKSGPDGPPLGQWHLVFDRVGAWHLDPLGSGLLNAVQIGNASLTVYAPIQLAPLKDGRGGVTRYGHHNIGGHDCYDDGPFGTYTWSVAGNKLTLTGVSEKCGNRAAIWEGVWTRTP